MKKNILLLLFASIILQANLIAQTKSNAETKFVNKLNNILQNTKHQHWKYKGIMSIDSVFAINKAGILSVCLRYTDVDSSIVRVRMEASVKSIKKITYDLYLILEYNGDEVSVFESTTNSNVLMEVFKTNYLHIGVPVADGYKQKETLQKLVDDLLKYYSN